MVRVKKAASRLAKGKQPEASTLSAVSTKEISTPPTPLAPTFFKVRF